jgi:hypothetical protein
VAGKAAFDALLGKRFEIDQPGVGGWYDQETSPYGVALNVSYPVCDPDALIQAAQAAMPDGKRSGPRGEPGFVLRFLIA